MIPVETLIAEFQRMYREHWSYVWGSHEEGCVDCSGAFYYVFHKYGLPIYNGSNRIARVYCIGLIPYAEAKANGLIVPGMLAFKHRKPGDQYYDLGSGYKPKGAYYNGDLNDYYHIGVVDDDVKYVLNAQSSATGFVRSKITEKWSHVAYAKYVDYGKMPESEVVSMTMVVVRTASTSSSTNTVNVRKIKDGAVLTTVRFGDVVEALQDDGTWTQVNTPKGVGWMKSEFLKPQEEQPAASDGIDYFTAYNELYSKINAVMEEIGKKWGVG